MDIQEILGKLTEEQKRELLEATKVAVLESESAPEKAVENKPAKFWTKDRICTIFAFICSLGLWAFVDSAPWFVLSSIFWAPFAFYKLNPVTIKRTPEQEAKKERTFINSEGEDVTTKCNEHIPALILIFPVCIVFVILLCITTAFYTKLSHNVPEYMRLLFTVTPGYILFFGYAFISGVPLSAFNASIVDGFHNPLPESQQKGVAKNNPMTFSSISSSDTRRLHSPSYSHHASNAYNWTTRK
jgi:hypothetical protein